MGLPAAAVDAGLPARRIPSSGAPAIRFEPPVLGMDLFGGAAGT
jgi:hypothetical protein